VFPISVIWKIDRFGNVIVAVQNKRIAELFSKSVSTMASVGLIRYSNTITNGDDGDART